MKKTAITFLLALLMLATGGLLAERPQPQPQPQPQPLAPRILLLGSYHYTHSWSMAILQALRTELVRNNKGGVLDYLELNAVRTSIADVDAKFAPALAAARQGKYDVIVAILDDAVELLCRHQAELPPGLPVIAYGKAQTLRKLRQLHPNTTGIMKRFPLAETLQFGLQLFPDTEEILVIIDPAESREDVIREIDTHTNANPHCRIRTVNGGEFTPAQLIEMGAKLPVRSFSVLSFRRDYMRDNYATIHKLAEDYFRQSPRPGLIMSETLLDAGALGGVLARSNVNGRQLAEVVQKALADKKIGDLALQRERGVPLVDCRTAQRFDLPMSRIPAAAERLYAPERRSRSHRGELLLLLGVIVLLGGVLAVGAWRYWIAIRELRRSRMMVRLLPLRLCILNREDEILFYQDESGNQSTERYRSLNDLPFLPADEVRTIADAVWHDGTPRSIHYRKNNRTLVAACTKLPPEIFGCDSLLWAAQDASALDMATRNESAAKELLQAILDSLPVGVAVKDADRHYRFLLANPAFARAVDRPIPEIEGRDDYELQLRTFDPNLCRRQDIQVMSSGHPISLMREGAMATDGVAHTYQVTKLPLHTQSGRNLLIGVYADITHNLELERRQQLLIDELNNRIANEEIVNACLQHLTSDEDFGRSIDGVLQVIGEKLHAVNCFVFGYNAGDDTLGCRYEWIAPDAVSYREHTVRFAADRLDPLFRDGLMMLPDLDDAPEELREFAATMRLSGTQALLVLALRKDGVLYGFTGAAFAEKRREFSQSDVAMAHDVGKFFVLADERRSQQALREEIAQRQQRVFDSVNIPTVLYDPEFKVVMLNQAGSELCGRSFDQVVGTHCSRHLCRYARTKFCNDSECPIRAVLATGKPFRRLYSFRKREYRLQAQPIFDRNGNLLYILQNLVDITDLQESKRQLAEAMEAAQAGNRAKSYFISTMSHEIRTPLNAVIGLSELLKEGRCTEAERQEYYDSIARAGNVLLNLTNDVLAMSQFEEEPQRMQQEDVSLAELTQELDSLFRKSAEAKNLTFRTVLPENPPLLRLDAPRLRQILFKLLGNAIKFTNEGGVTLELEYLPTAIRTGTLTVRVSDTGIGIKKEFQEHVFAPFAQQDANCGNRRYNGSGLGLTIVRQLAEQMKGVLTLRSEENRGSVFSIEFPDIQSATPAAVKPAALPGSWHGARRMLLVDDVPMNLKVIGAMLRKLGVEYEEANSAREALAKIAETKFDVILTDLWMPELDGAELAAAIRSNPSNALTDIYAVTADVEAGQNFDICNFKGVLYKPVTLAKLMRIVVNGGN